MILVLRWVSCSHHCFRLGGQPTNGGRGWFSLCNAATQRCIRRGPGAWDLHGCLWDVRAVRAGARVLSVLYGMLVGGLASIRVQSDEASFCDGDVVSFTGLRCHKQLNSVLGVVCGCVQEQAAQGSRDRGKQRRYRILVQGACSISWVRASSSCLVRASPVRITSVAYRDLVNAVLAGGTYPMASADAMLRFKGRVRADSSEGTTGMPCGVDGQAAAKGQAGANEGQHPK